MHFKLVHQRLKPVQTNHLSTIIGTYTRSIIGLRLCRSERKWSLHSCISL